MLAYVVGVGQQFSVMLVFGIRMSQRPSDLFLIPFRVTLLFLNANIFDLFRMIEQPSSHSYTIEIRLELFSLGKTIAFLAVEDKCSFSSSSPLTVAAIMLLFGSCTCGLLILVNFLKFCHLFASSSG